MCVRQRERERESVSLCMWLLTICSRVHAGIASTFTAISKVRHKCCKLCMLSRHVLVDHPCAGGLHAEACVVHSIMLLLLQAGLAQLETALESMDRPAGSSSSRPYNGEGSNGGGQAYMPDDLPAERVLSIAIHISEMPSTRQEEALARLPRPVRQKVMALLREQAVIEGEEQMQGQGPGGSAFGPSSNGNSRPAAPEDAVIHTTEYSLNDADKQQPATPVGRPGRATPVQAAAAAGGQGKPSPAAAAAAPAPTAPAAAVSLQVEEEDLLGMSSPNPAATAAGPDRLASVADIDDFFSGGAAAPAAPGSSTSSRASQRPRSAHASVGSSGGSSMSRVLSGSDGQLADLLGGSGAAVSSSKATAPHKSNSMINLGGLEQLHLPVDVSQHG